MSGANSVSSFESVAVIIPVLNERENLTQLLPILLDLGLGQIIVADNGSCDGSTELAHCFGVTVSHEPAPGYGATCYTGMTHLNENITVVVFLDADLADDPMRLPELVSPILTWRCDFVLGARAAHLRRPGSMNAVQVFGNRLAAALILIGWGYRYRFGDLAPFRAIRRDALERINMRDRAFGWTVEMQIRAVEEELRTAEVPMPYFRRRGRSKISGTLRGVVLAGYWIIRTCAALWLTKHRRRRRACNATLHQA